MESYPAEIDHAWPPHAVDKLVACCLFPNDVHYEHSLILLGVSFANIC
jgi:hypothetical protein